MQVVATADYTASYKGIGIESHVEFEAQYAAQGFDDVRAIAARTGLQSLMLGEEAMLLGGNTSLALGTTPTPTLSGAATGGALAAQTWSVIAVALALDGVINGTVTGGIQSTITRTNADGSTDVFGGGAAARSAAATVATTGATGSITASVAPVPGALGYAWFWGAAGAEVLGAITTINSVLITAAATGAQTAAALGTVDRSTSALSFDGLLTQAFRPGSGATIVTLDAENRRLWRFQVRSDGMGAEAIASRPFAFIPRNFLSDGLVRAHAAPFIGVRTEGNTMLTQNTGRRTAQALALTLALSLGASGAAYAKNPMVGGAPMYAQKTIVENAVNSKDHTTLVAAVKAAGLVDTLNGPGPFTVFAPTNAAFAKLPPGTVESLVQPQNKATLTKILTYHVVPGVYTAKDLMALAKKGGGQGVLTTVEGEPLAVEVQGKKVLVTDQKGNTATVTIPNVMQSNGVIHVINAVLMP